MNEIKQEIISIRRAADTVDGKVIGYLKSTPLELDKDFSDLVMATLKKHWHTLTLFSLGVRGESLRQNGIWAISELEAQINIIRRICGINADPVAMASNLGMPASTTQQYPTALTDTETQQINSRPEEEEYEDDDDDEEHREMEQLPEMIMANKALGFNS